MRGDRFDMKKITELLLAATLCLCLAACCKEPAPGQSSHEIHTEAADTEESEDVRQQSGSSTPSGNVEDSSKEPAQQSIELVGP